ncbi:hypothetical protein FRC07_007867 [Ceratobasidium sp. 392]|nr:hypothetical protein FRC07_007867 [Ceratobasidium sp. 392]
MPPKRANPPVDDGDDPDSTIGPQESPVTTVKNRALIPQRGLAPVASVSKGRITKAPKVPVSTPGNDTSDAPANKRRKQGPQIDESTGNEGTAQPTAGTASKKKASRARSSADATSKQGAQKRTRKSTVGVVVATDGEGTSAREGSTNEWLDTAYENIMNQQDDVVTAPEEVELQKTLQNALIGSAFITGFGPKCVRNAFELDNPASRANPRGIDDAHVKTILASVKVPNNKRDHKSPIVFAVSRSRLSLSLQEKMAAADAFNPSVAPPRLVLNSPNPDRERLLVEEIWKQHTVQGRMLTLDEAKAHDAELEELRKTLERCLLFNGNHRISAVLALGDEIKKDHVALMRSISGREPTDDEKLKMQDIADRMRDECSWRCLVYDSECLPPRSSCSDPHRSFIVLSLVTRRALRIAHMLTAFTVDKLTPAVRSHLVINRETLAEKRTHGGELLWYMCGLADQWLNTARATASQSGKTLTRAEEASECFKEFLKSDSKNTLAQDTTASEKKTAKRKGGKVVYQAIEDRTVIRMFTDQLCWELMLTSRFALPVFTNIISQAHAQHMCSAQGASLATQVWLSIRLLMMTFDVVETLKITDIELFIQENPIVLDGYERATEHWKVLVNKSPKNATPVLVNQYQRGDLDEAFGKLYDELIVPLEHATRGFEYRSNTYVLAVRNLFEQFARTRIASSVQSMMRPVRAALSIYARLPTAPEDPSLEKNDAVYFYPAALLPSRTWMNRCTNKWAHEDIKDIALASFDTVLDDWSLMWTLGAAGSSRAMNAHRWYYRAHALKQYGLCFVSREYGSLCGRLDLAIRRLDDPRVLEAVRAFKDVPYTMSDLIKDCGASKSGPTTYAYASTAYTTSATSWADKPESVFREAFRLARLDAKDYFYKNKGKNMLNWLKNNDSPILAVVAESFWQFAHPWDWVSGWQDKEGKQMKTFNGLLGWGMTCERMKRQVLPLVLHDSLEGRHFVRMAVDICDAQGVPCLAEKTYKRTYPPLPSTPAPSPAPRVTRSMQPVVDEPATTLKGLEPDIEKEKAPVEKAKAPVAAPATVPVPGPVKAKTAASTGPAAKSGKPPPKSPAIIPPELDADTDEDEEETDGGEKTGGYEAGPGTDIDAAFPGEEDDGAVRHALPPRLSSKLLGKQPARRAPVSITDRPSTVRCAVPIIRNASGQCDPLRQGEIDLTDVAIRSNPGHILVSPRFSPRAIANLDGLGARRDVNNHRFVFWGAEAQSAALGVDRTMEAIDKLSVARDNFRSSLHDMGACIANLALGPEFVVSAFGSVISGLKDAYLTRLATIFMDVYGMDVEQAINEAMWIVDTDELTENAVLLISGKNEIVVNTITTFPKSVQDQILAEGSLAETVGKFDEADLHRFEAAERCMRYFHPVRGVGSTEDESINRGTLAAATLLARQSMEKEDRRAGVLYLNTNEVLIPSTQEVWDPTRNSLSKAADVLTNRLTCTNVRNPSGQSKDSAFSTGIFSRPQIFIPEPPAARRTKAFHYEPLPPRLAQDLTKAASTAAAAFKLDANQSLVDYRARLDERSKRNSSSGFEPLTQHWPQSPTSNLRRTTAAHEGRKDRDEASFQESRDESIEEATEVWQELGGGQGAEQDTEDIEDGDEEQQPRAAGDGSRFSTPSTPSPDGARSRRPLHPLAGLESDSDDDQTTRKRKRPTDSPTTTRSRPRPETESQDLF